MLFDEARIRQRLLAANRDHIHVMVELEQISRLEKLQRAARVIQARLGLSAAVGA
jgi:hypothetical protein